MRTLSIGILLLIAMFLPQRTQSQVYREVQYFLDSLYKNKHVDTFYEYVHRIKNAKDNNLSLLGYTNLARIKIKMRDLDSVPEILDHLQTILHEQDNIEKDSLHVFLLGRYYELSGHYHYQTGNPVLCLEHLTQASKYYKESNAPHFEAYNYNMMGTINYLSGRYDQSMTFHMEAYKILTSSYTDSSLLLDVNVDIANLYQKTDNNQKAIEYNQNLLRWPKKYITDDMLADIYNNIGINYLYLEENQKAKSYLNKAYALFQEHNITSKTVDKVINNLAYLHMEEENYEEAENLYKRSILLKEKSGNLRDISLINGNLALVYIKTKQFDKAEKHGLEALKNAQDFNLLDRIQSANLTLSSVYESKGDYKKALSYLRKSNAIKDSMQISSLQTRINFIEQQYDREREIINLENLQKEKEIVDLQYEMSQLMNTILVIFILGLIIFSIFWYKNHRAKQNVEKIINQKNIELATVNSLVRGQEEERNRIARELHDSLGNTIALLNSKIQKEQPYNKELLELVEDASTELHTISHDLMPGILLRFGLSDALDDLVKKWMLNSDLSVDLNIGDLGFSNDDPTALTIYRIVQELIKNAVEKGKATFILIEIFETSERLTINCEDNGSGFDKSLANAGLGIKNIETRVSYLKGTMMIDSGSNGSRFRIIIPYENTGHI